MQWRLTIDLKQDGLGTDLPDEALLQSGVDSIRAIQLAAKAVNKRLRQTGRQVKSYNFKRIKAAGPVLGLEPAGQYEPDPRSCQVVFRYRWTAQGFKDTMSKVKEILDAQGKSTLSDLQKRLSDPSIFN